MVENRLGEAADNVFLAMSGTQQSITHLNLSSAKITHTSIFPLCKMLQYNTTLVHLNLENNKLKQESGKVIALAMNQNTTLCHLKLAGNKHNRSVLSQDDIMNFHARTKFNVCISIPSLSPPSL